MLHRFMLRGVDLIDSKRYRIGGLISEFITVRILTAAHIQRGFGLLFDDLEEIMIDAPKSLHYVSQWIAPLIANDRLSLAAKKQLTPSSYSSAATKSGTGSGGSGSGGPTQPQQPMIPADVLADWNSSIGLAHSKARPDIPRLNWLIYCELESMFEGLPAAAELPQFIAFLGLPTNSAELNSLRVSM